MKKLLAEWLSCTARTNRGRREAGYRQFNGYRVTWQQGGFSRPALWDAAVPRASPPLNRPAAGDGPRCPDRADRPEGVIPPARRPARPARRESPSPWPTHGRAFHRRWNSVSRPADLSFRRVVRRLPAVRARSLFCFPSPMPAGSAARTAPPSAAGSSRAHHLRDGRISGHVQPDRTDNHAQPYESHRDSWHVLNLSSVRRPDPSVKPYTTAGQGQAHNRPAAVRHTTAADDENSWAKFGGRPAGVVTEQSDQSPSGGQAFLPVFSSQTGMSGLLIRTVQFVTTPYVCGFPSLAVSAGADCQNWLSS